MPTFKEILQKKRLKTLDRMLFIKKSALNKKDPKCEAGWKDSPYCNPVLRDEKEIEHFRNEMEKPIGRLKFEIQAITDEIHARGELTADEIEAKKSGEQPTLKF